jgi:pyruvate dehydrogenase E2 component (dihydrolipoamide acetyltransferase)
MAGQAGLDWRSVAGGGLLARDEQRCQPELAEPTALAKTIPASTPPDDEPLEIIPLSGVRGLIAERMALSHSQTAPVTLTTEVDATALVELRSALASDNIEASYNDLLLCVLAHALREHPRLNATWLGNIMLWRAVHIAIAIDTERGLLAPVIRNVDRKGLGQISQESKALTARARLGACTPEELRGSTFTLTNLGMFGIDAFTPLVNLPECAVLGVGRIKTQPVMVDNAVVGRQMLWLSLTFDHRLVDGGPAARFLQRVSRLVERPIS